MGRVVRGVFACPFEVKKFVGRESVLWPALKVIMVAVSKNVAVSLGKLPARVVGCSIIEPREMTNSILPVFAENRFCIYREGEGGCGNTCYNKRGFHGFGVWRVFEESGGK